MDRNSINFNAWANNPLKTRRDVAQALEQQVEPLIPAFTEDGARVSLADTSAFFRMQSAELEGFARPLWGIVPFVYGGGDFKYWEMYRKGFANGTNPKHPAYWGEVDDFDGRVSSYWFCLVFGSRTFLESITG